MPPPGCIMTHGDQKPPHRRVREWLETAQRRWNESYGKQSFSDQGPPSTRPAEAPPGLFGWLSEQPDGYARFLTRSSSRGAYLGLSFETGEPIFDYRNLSVLHLGPTGAGKSVTASHRGVIFHWGPVLAMSSKRNQLDETYLMRAHVGPSMAL
jgi:hypothetical protein